MRTKEYGQYCGLARALDVVGERWSLLIVRDLLVRPRRYTDLLEGLRGIPTNVLSSRLKELEAAGVVERRILAAPERGVAYALTDDGQELDQAVRLLGRWGAQRLDEPREGERVTTESLISALRSTFRPEETDGLELTFEVRAGDVVLHARVEDGLLVAGPGPDPDGADLVIEVSPESPTALKQLLAGEVSPTAALADRLVTVVGPRRLLTVFVKLFRI